MLGLQEKGCHNINFVTPEHVAPQLAEAIALAVPLGLRVPIVYNTSAYDRVAVLRELDGVVDVYLPDLKYGDDRQAVALSTVSDYVAVSGRALREMGPAFFSSRRKATARPLYLRGLAMNEDSIFAGFSPATIVQIDRHTGEWVDSYFHSDDARVCIHGLAI